MGRRDSGGTQAPTVTGTAKPSAMTDPIATEDYRGLAGPIEHGRQQRARDGEVEHGREHGHVRPRGKSRARAGQGVTDPRVTGDGDPGWPQRCFREAVHSDQLRRQFLLTAPRIPYWTSRDPRRPGDRTDNDQ